MICEAFLHLSTTSQGWVNSVGLTLSLALLSTRTLYSNGNETASCSFPLMRTREASFAICRMALVH